MPLGRVNGSGRMSGVGKCKIDVLLSFSALWERVCFCKLCGQKRDDVTLGQCLQIWLCRGNLSYC